jgi:subtilisin-like proprotein convertase family protein
MDAGWSTNAAGFHFNHKYGAGLVNASGAVALALGWTNLPPRESLGLDLTNLALSIPDNMPAGVSVSFAVSNTNLRVEQVALHAELDHDDWGDLEIIVQSPSGMKSVLAEPHSPSFGQGVDWTFTSVRHWGEQAAGTWTVTIADRRFFNLGEVQSLRLELHGAQPATTPPLLAIRRLSDAVELTLTAGDDESYVLESSPTPGGWLPLVTLVPVNGLATHRDTRPLSAAQFYRVTKSGR